MLEAVKKEKLLTKETQLNLSRPERYKLGLARAKLLRRMSDSFKWDTEDAKMCEALNECLVYLGLMDGHKGQNT